MPEKNTKCNSKLWAYWIIKKFKCVDNGNLNSNVNTIDSEKDKKKKFINKHSDVFTGMSAFPDEVAVKLNKNIVPKIFPARSIPFTIRDKLKDTLYELISMEIIEEINEPTELVSNMLVVEK